MKSLYKNIATMVAGTGLSQLLAIAVAPILTRVFTPEDFGLLAVYGAIVSIISIIASGRYEMAVMIPEEEAKAWDLIKAALLITGCTTVAVGLIVVGIHFSGYKISFIERLGYIKFLIPVGVFLTATFNVLTVWGTRISRYKRIAGSKLIQTTSNSGTAIATGFGKISGGLILGQLVGLTSAIIMMLRTRFKGEASGASFKDTIKAYKDYPAKSGASGVFGLLGHQLPVLLLGELFLDGVLGLYSLVMKVMNLPLNMLGKSISQVYFQEVSARIRGKQDVKRYVYKFTGQLFLLITPPMAVIFVWGPELFSFVFGSEWAEAGMIAGYFSIYYIFRFVYFSQSTIFSAMRKLGVEIYMNAAFLLLQISSVLVGHYVLESYKWAFLMMAVSGFAVYLVYLSLVLRAAKALDK